jgi:hypothetical protein
LPTGDCGLKKDSVVIGVRGNFVNFAVDALISKGYTARKND